MKTIKQSRIDRLARKRKRHSLKLLRESRLTEVQKYKLAQIALRKYSKQIDQEANKKCLHGIGFSGHECLVCNADKIATQIRDEWSPPTTYKILVYDDMDGCVSLTTTTRAITKKIVEMQNNGFWYVWKGSPVFFFAGNIRAIVLDGVVQSHGYNDPPTEPGPVNYERIQSFRK